MASFEARKRGAVVPYGRCVIYSRWVRYARNGMTITVQPSGHGATGNTAGAISLACNPCSW